MTLHMNYLLQYCSRKRYVSEQHYNLTLGEMKNKFEHRMVVGSETNTKRETHQNEEKRDVVGRRDKRGRVVVATWQRA